MMAFEIMPLLIPHQEDAEKLNELWKGEQTYLVLLDEIRRGRNKESRPRCPHVFASIPGPTVNIPSPGQYRSGLPALDYSPFTNREDHRNYIRIQIAAHARQIYFWTEREDEIYQNYQAALLGTAMNFNAEYPTDKIERRKLGSFLFEPPQNLRAPQKTFV